jgi:DNA mismatch endonuclease (patch repair protein)
MTKNKNTNPERIVQKLLGELGIQFCKHVKELPGTPDIVIPSIKLAILVHGCYWHRHSCIKFADSSNEVTSRDVDVVKQLKAAGYTALILWECDVISQRHAVKQRLGLSISASAFDPKPITQAP